MVELNFTKEVRMHMKYSKRMMKNLPRLIKEQGYDGSVAKCNLETLSGRHLWNVQKGHATITIEKLEEVANEIGVDFMDFFKK